MPELLVGTADGLYRGVLPSENPAEGADLGRELEGREVRALALDSRACWAIADGESVLRSEAPGSWEEAAVTPGAQLTCLLPTPEGLLAGTAEAHLLRLRDGALHGVESFEEADGRESWYTPWGGPPDTRSLSSDAAGALFANVHVGGILRSLDAGESWHPTLPIDTDVHQVLVHPERPGVVLAPAAVGLAISLDGGDSWNYETGGLHATYCRAVAASGDVVLVTASTGPRGHQAALYRRSLDDDEGFRPCRAGLPKWFSSNIDTGCLAASGVLAAFGTADGRLFLSADGGETWDLLTEGLPPVTGVALA
jgi:hypothetical protein